MPLRTCEEIYTEAFEHFHACGWQGYQAHDPDVLYQKRFWRRVLTSLIIPDWEYTHGYFVEPMFYSTLETSRKLMDGSQQCGEDPENFV